MGQMKEIYCMVQDGSAEQFKDAYKKALINNEITFMYGGKHYDILKAKSIVRLINRAEEDYIEHQAEMHAEWEAEIRRGK
tara:strand:+ start:1258 stop:1497 length:240 start_codon:yes stop_codon:yes gene_type:complete